MSSVIIESRFGIGYRQSPYLYNSIGFKAVIANGNVLEGVTAKPNYIWFYERNKKWIKNQNQ